MEDKEIWLILFQAILASGEPAFIRGCAEQADKALKEYKDRWECR